MFDIGFIEMLVIGLILLLVVGPERLPEVARTVGGWVHQAKQYLDSMKSELDRDLQLSELDRQTRQATDTEAGPQDTRGGPGQPGEEDAAGEADAGGGEDTPASRPHAAPDADQGALADSGAETAAEAEPDSTPDAEDQAASDMERELDDDEQDGERRG
ncbi:MAG TPA: Sec-independent protein translocase protein TatB [Gammaproteobacteria bacterium]|nr:Sec-independent protein translocase protein TatB [Gammaproteobacteria bacterium]